MFVGNSNNRGNFHLESPSTLNSRRGRHHAFFEEGKFMNNPNLGGLRKTAAYSSQLERGPAPHLF